MLISAALLCVGLSGCAVTPYTTRGYDDYPRSHHEVYYRPAPPVRYVAPPHRPVVYERMAAPERHAVYERSAPRMAQAASPPDGQDRQDHGREDRHHDRNDERGDHRPDRRG
jgi:hypothetical protein